MKIKTNKKFFKIAKNESIKSNYKHKIGCVAVKGGKIISSGFNKIRYKSKGINKYSKWSESLHAERDCLSKLDKENIIGCDIYIYREYKNGNSALAKPCPQCSFMLSDLGVKRVFFSISEEPYFEVIKL